MHAKARGLKHAWVSPGTGWQLGKVAAGQHARRPGTLLVARSHPWGSLGRGERGWLEGGFAPSSGCISRQLAPAADGLMMPELPPSFTTHFSSLPPLLTPPPAPLHHLPAPVHAAGEQNQRSGGGAGAPHSSAPPPARPCFSLTGAAAALPVRSRGTADAVSAQNGRLSASRARGPSLTRCATSPGCPLCAFAPRPRCSHSAGMVLLALVPVLARHRRVLNDP